MKLEGFRDGGEEPVRQADQGEQHEPDDSQVCVRDLDPAQVLVRNKFPGHAFAQRKPEAQCGQCGAIPPTRETPWNVECRMTGDVLEQGEHSADGQHTECPDEQWLPDPEAEQHAHGTEVDGEINSRTGIGAWTLSSDRDEPQAHDDLDRTAHQRGMPMNLPKIERKADPMSICEEQRTPNGCRKKQPYEAGHDERGRMKRPRHDVREALDEKPRVATEP